MKKRQPFPPPFQFENPKDDDEMLGQLAGYLAALVMEVKAGKRRERALKKLEEEDLPAALQAINKPPFLAGHILNQAMDVFAAYATDQLGAKPPPWWSEPQD